MNFWSIFDGLIAAIITVALTAFFGWRKAKKIQEKAEAKRNIKLDQLISDVQELQESFKDHTHNDLNRKFDQQESKCQLREAHIDSIVERLAEKVNDHLTIISDLKQAIKPLGEIQTGIAVISEKMVSIDKVLGEKLHSVARRIDDLEDKVYQK